MSTTWYRTTSYMITIEAVQVESETPKTITTIEEGFTGKPYRRKRVKESHGDKYFPTWAQAYDQLRQRVEREVENAEASLAEANKEAVLVEKMTPPK